MNRFSGNFGSLNDPSDWNQTLLPSLKELDSLKRCFICKEFFKAPVVTSCNHTFCSQCIREYLIEKPQCPLCKTELFESNLRRDILLEEIVSCYSRIRPQLYELLAKDEEELARLQHERKDESVEVVRDSSPEVEVIEDSEDEEVPRKRARVDERAKSDERTRSDVDLVECPICSDKMTALELQSKHLDECLSGKKPVTNVKPRAGKPANSGSGIASFFQAGRSRNTSSTSPQSEAVHTDFYFKEAHKHKQATRKLPKLDFSSLTTPKIKEKLVGLKLSTAGTRQQMEMRFNHWYVLFNSNLDSNRPVPEMILRQKMNQWELSVNKGSLFGIRSSHNISDKNFSRKQWSQEHKREYTRLIKAARTTAKEAPQTADLTHETANVDSSELGMELDPATPPQKEVEAGPAPPATTEPSKEDNNTTTTQADHLQTATQLHRPAEHAHGPASSLSDTTTVQDHPFEDTDLDSSFLFK